MLFKKKINSISSGGRIAHTATSEVEFADENKAQEFALHVFNTDELAAHFEIRRLLNGVTIISVYTRGNTLILQLSNKPA